MCKLFYISYCALVVMHKLSCISCDENKFLVQSLNVYI